MEARITVPPADHNPIAEWAAEHGYRRHTCARAARRGDVPGAVQVFVSGAPQPTWFVPVDLIRKPAERRRPPRQPRR